MDDQSVLIRISNYALETAIGKRDYDAVKYCIDHGAGITTWIIMRYLIIVNIPGDSLDSLPIVSQKDPMFDTFIDKLPADAVFNEQDMLKCLYYSNRYYLETILSTQHYCNKGSELLYRAARDRAIPQYVANLLVKHGFTIYVQITGRHCHIDHFALSRVIVAGIEMSNQLLTSFNKSLKSLGPVFNSDTHKLLPLMINYLTSRPRARSHFIISKYIIYDVIGGSIETLDVSNYIWTLYCINTFIFDRYWVAKYQNILNTLKS
jgi:hypothetical protein